MGGGSYSIDSRVKRATSLNYASAPRNEIFKQRNINNAMNPHGIKVRESRDSEEHPNSVAIILGLDVTGSMGSIPHHLIKEGLPHIMDNIIKDGEPDPQVLFLGIGDHECDESPLQVGQFESSDELLDKWLTDVWLESGGGGNYGESYLLAWYFAAQHTSIDCLEKRSKKGFLFTIGDEPVLKSIRKSSLQNLMGDGQYENYDALALLEKAKEKYNVYHVHVKEGCNGERQEVMDGWKQLLGENLIIVDKHPEVSTVIAQTVLKNKDKTTTTQTEEDLSVKDEEVVL